MNPNVDTLGSVLNPVKSRLSVASAAVETRRPSVKKIRLQIPNNTPKVIEQNNLVISSKVPHSQHRQLLRNPGSLDVTKLVEQEEETFEMNKIG